MNLELKISRYLPDRIDPPRFETFEVEISESASILEALDKIRLEQDSSLLYRRSCHHSSCGTCAIRVNGREALACITPVGEEESSEIILEPLEGFDRLGDLVVDITPLYANISVEWSYLRAVENQPTQNKKSKKDRWKRFEDCIECGACVSACPVAGSKQSFRGPAALAALERELTKNPAGVPELLDQAAGPDGAGGCQRALLCSRVCPTKVYPSKSIHDLLKLLDE